MTWTRSMSDKDGRRIRSTLSKARKDRSSSVREKVQWIVVEGGQGPSHDEVDR